MATELQVSLDGAERSILADLAQRELPDPPDQLRHILRQELQRRGLLPSTSDGQAGQGGGDEQ